MGINYRKLTTLLSILACLVTILACSIPTRPPTEAPTEEVIGIPVEETEEVEESEIFIPLVEGGDETEAETEAPEAEEATSTPEPPTATPIAHVFIPGEPGWVSKYFYDTDSSTTAASKSAAGGDDYYSNKYERPFSQTDMVYYPDLDILKAEISHDDNFFYISITVKGLNPSTGNLTGTFGAELDTDLDGRGDYLLYCDVPNFNDWRIDTTHAFKDTNNDVGGALPTRHDANYSGDGFETMIFSPSILDDPDGLWCRQRAGADVKVDLAIHKPLVGNPGQFAWGVWTDLGLKQPGWFDYNDHFTFDQAGSPMSGTSYYPLKDIHSLDSTCRESFGFEPSVEILGMCFVPTPTPTSPPLPSPTPTNTLPPRPGTVQGVACNDMNNNGSCVGDPLTGYDVTIRLHRDFCGPGYHVLVGSTTNKSYSFTVAPGNYCVYISPNGSMTTPYEYSITITSSTTITRNFGYYVVGR